MSAHPVEGGVEGELVGPATRQRKEWPMILRNSTFMERNEKKEVMGEMLRNLKIAQMKLSCT